MEKTAKDLKRHLYFLIMTTVEFVWLLLGTSCEKEVITRSMDQNEYTEIIEDSVKSDGQSGISFEMDSDTLTEEIEEVHFQAKEWEDVGMDADKTNLLLRVR